MMPLTAKKRLAVLVAALSLLLLMATPSRVLGFLLPNTIQLGGFGGTLWQGQAARAYVTIGDKVIHLGRVSWELKPWSLLLFSPSIDLDARWGQQRLTGNVRLPLGGGLTLRNIDAAVGVETIRAFLPLYVGGALEAQLPVMRLESIQPPVIDRVEGRLIWRNGVWTARAGDVALGNYAMELTGEEGSLVGRLQTLSGPLEANGQLTLEEQHYRVALALRGPATANEGLRGSLRLMATPVADGFDLTINGQL